MEYTDYNADVDWQADGTIDDMDVFFAMQQEADPPQDQQGGRPGTAQQTGPTAPQQTGPTGPQQEKQQTQASAGRRTIDVNGYAFPNISDEALNNTLPNLTFLSPFSYQVKPDGTLTPIKDTPLVQTARAKGVAPMMVISNIGEDGFSSDIAHEVLNDTQVQQTLLDNVVKTLKSKNYYGLDIDFEYVYPNDREAYNRFLEKVVARLRPLGYSIVSALAPKTSADQQGLLYEAHDYAAHGRLMDHVILMTYEWGYTYGPPMAVAPIDQVRRVLDFAVSVIPSEKILMGMPNYGYDWTLPYKKGTAARSLSFVQARELAQKEGATIEFDETAQAPYFNYTDDEGVEHVVWFDNEASIRARLGLIDDYNLGGVSYWTINRYSPESFTVLNEMYNVNKLLKPTE